MCHPSTSSTYHMKETNKEGTGEKYGKFKFIFEEE